MSKQYSKYDYAYAEVAHQAYIESLGMKWSRAAFEALDQPSKDAWAAAALAVNDTFARAVMA